MVDLMKFCNVDKDSCPNMDQPWSAGDYSYATNGHILIRVPRRIEIPERHDAPSCPSVFAFFSKEPKTWQVMPQVFPEPPAVCKFCGGTGKVYYCPECDGEGDLLFENTYSRYTVTCDTCCGDQVVPKNLNPGGLEKTCYCCEGSGNRQEHNAVPVGGFHFSDVYLSWIAELPGAEIGVYSSGDPLRYRFSGGDGLLMPREEYSGEVA